MPAAAGWAARLMVPWSRLRVAIPLARLGNETRRDTTRPSPAGCSASRHGLIIDGANVRVCQGRWGWACAMSQTQAQSQLHEHAQAQVMVKRQEREKTLWSLLE